MADIPFNRPFVAGNEIEYIKRAITDRRFAGNGDFTARCNDWLEANLRCHRAMLTHSCTAALEMAALLADIGPGDEVILPSFTHVSTANAFALRGARLVFADIRPDTLNLDERRLGDLVTERTRAIVPVHYAGVGCEMDAIMSLAEQAGILVIEDAAQSLMSSYRGRKLGTIGHLGALSFHETKNVTCGEGGALLVNDPSLVDRAEIIREAGTDRMRFLRDEVDAYTWVGLGSSYLPSDLLAAFLLAQLERVDEIISVRRAICETYRHGLKDLAAAGRLRLLEAPEGCDDNGHLFTVIVPTGQLRDDLIVWLSERGIQAVFHYIPLHLSAMGQTMGYSPGDLPITEKAARSILRLPCYVDLTEADQQRVIAAVQDFFE
jgi:dTDP-4-amino-4,6-dideoxygalactose transaminase